MTALKRGQACAGGKAAGERRGAGGGDGRGGARADPKLKIAVGYILRFNPVYRGDPRALRSGQLGQIYYLEGDYIHNLLYQAKQTDTRTGVNWYLEYERPIVGGGSHPLDLLRWFSGAQVVEVAGVFQPCGLSGDERGRLPGGALSLR